MCTVLLPPGVNSIAVNKYINITNIILITLPQIRRIPIEYIFLYVR